MTHTAAIETEVLSEFMPLVAAMACNGTHDGMPRAPMMMCVSTLGVAWVVEVIDRHCQLGFAAMALTLDAAMATASEMLSSGNAPWLPLKGKGILGR